VEHWLFGLSASSGRLVRPQGTERLIRGASRPSTLLGPEGTAARRHPQQGRIFRSPMGRGDRDLPYLENCTVDASIICSCQVNKGTR
jgi:hypothetical protein